MTKSSYHDLLHACSSEEEIQKSTEYLFDNLKSVINSSDLVVVCFSHLHPTDIGTIVGNAVQMTGARCVFWDRDNRWNSLLQLTFLTKATTIVGPPLILLGLAKLAFHEHIPLNITNAISAGYPCTNWMIEAIEQTLDCHSYGILGPGVDSVITGFSCSRFRGVHLRTDAFQFDLLDDHSISVNDDCKGALVISPQKVPSVKHVLPVIGSIYKQPCLCGRESPRFGNIEPSVELHGIDIIMEKLQLWSSILDCDVIKGQYGLEIEIVSFAGERLPPIPDCSRLILRHWNPDQDIPLSVKYLSRLGEYP